MEQKDAALLVWMDGDEIQGRWPLTKPVTSIGRAADNDIAVDDRWVSRYHAQVHRDQGRYLVVDQDSKNGTLLNGKRIAGPTPLSDGDQLQVTPLVKLTFVDYGSTAPLPGEPRPSGLTLDRDKRQVWLQGRLLTPPLSYVQFALLALLHHQPGRVYSRDEIIAALWPQDSADGISDEAIDALVRRIRLRLRELDPGRDYLVTVRGYGFKLQLDAG